MKALVGAFNQEKALVEAFSVIVQPVVEPMEHYTALVLTRYLTVRVRDVVCVVVAGAGCRHGAGAVSRVSHQVGDWSELAAVLRTHTQHSGHR